MRCRVVIKMQTSASVYKRKRTGKILFLKDNCTVFCIVHNVNNREIQLKSGSGAIASCLKSTCLKRCYFNEFVHTNTHTQKINPHLCLRILLNCGAKTVGLYFIIRSK